MCKYEDLWTWKQKEVCNLQWRTVHLKVSNPERGGLICAREEAGQIMQGSFGLEWEGAKIWHLSSEWLSCLKSNVIQTIERKEKYFPFAESKRDGKDFTILKWQRFHTIECVKCISHTICYMCIEGCVLKNHPKWKTKKKIFRDVQIYKDMRKN